MPDFRQTGDKPMRPQDHLGPDVKITRDVRPDDQWAQNMLKEIGKTIMPSNHTYMGSIAVHYYETGDRKLMFTNTVGGIATIQQLCTDELNEAVANMGIANVVIELKRRYGRQHKTVDSNDKRGAE